ncbi:unnamed protein product [Paramecium sonneborni]|uniref:Uncharacterized protein n=1 Tax=Paramecium sonneborni TaxID=65129 RepID=A0A8S1NLA7_9CILI|nr:unnamed protein product [Paramecium sonneborni]
MKSQQEYNSENNLRIRIRIIKSIINQNRKLLRVRDIYKKNGNNQDFNNNRDL